MSKSLQMTRFFRIDSAWNELHLMKQVKAGYECWPNQSHILLLYTLRVLLVYLVSDKIHKMILRMRGQWICFACVCIHYAIWKHLSHMYFLIGINCCSITANSSYLVMYVSFCDNLCMWCAVKCSTLFDRFSSVCQNVLSFLFITAYFTLFYDLRLISEWTLITCIQQNSKVFFGNRCQKFHAFLCEWMPTRCQWCELILYLLTVC